MAEFGPSVTQTFDGHQFVDASAPAPHEIKEEAFFSHITSLDSTNGSFGDSNAVIANNAAVNNQLTSKSVLLAVAAAFALFLFLHALKKANII